MRVNKYRGMTEDKKWLYGYYGAKGIDTEFEEHYIITDTLDIYADHTYPFYFTDNKVIKETIGQFTGLHDKNGVEVYEGDFVKINDIETGFVEYKEDICGFVVANKEKTKLCTFCDIFIEKAEIEVIGNIHERSEDNDK